jgi:hypothetical protein
MLDMHKRDRYDRNGSCEFHSLTAVLLSFGTAEIIGAGRARKIGLPARLFIMPHGLVAAFKQQAHVIASKNPDVLVMKRPNIVGK